LSVFIFTATSCRKDKKEDTTSLEDDKQTAADNTLSDQSFDDIQNVADRSMINTAGTMSYKTTACSATVTRSTDTTTIDFGPVNCTGTDGRTRRGKLIVVHTGGHYSDSGHSHTIISDSFYLNDNKITGYKKVTNMGRNSLGQPFFNIEINGTVTRTTGATITQVSNRVRTWTNGYTTKLNWSDDIYQITGVANITRTNSSGVVRNTAVTVSSSAPLVVAVGCRWIQAGTITFTSATGASRSLNYGTTAVCDDQATLTLANGTVHTITLP
jgi:hypothetical protein